VPKINVAAVRYAQAIFAALIAVFLRYLLAPFLGQYNPYHTVWLAVVFSAWFCGLWPSIIATVLGALGVWYWFLPPFHSFVINDQTEAFGMLGFLVLAACIIALGESSRQAFFDRSALAAIVDSSGDAIISKDLGGVITSWNRGAQRLFGWTAEEAVGLPITIIVPSELQQEEAEILKHMRAGEHIRDYETVRVTKAGARVDVSLTISPVRNPEGRVVGVSKIARDIGERKLLELQMSHLAQHDVLTDLPNRALFIDRLDQAIAFARRNNSRLAVLFLDLDGFKHINDSLGHAVGDKLLQAVGTRLKQCVRNSDTVSRQGGDEFVILLPEIARPEDVAISGQKILASLRAPHSVDEYTLQITASIGLCTYPEDGDDADTLIKNADTAMYQAKGNGSDTYQFFEKGMNIRAVQRQSLEGSLRHALERKEFVLHYQPKVNLKTGAISGVEALIRWMHPERGLIPPLEFVPIAEDCGLIVPISEWVMRESCKQARAWIDAGLPATPVAVNISSVEFRSIRFIETVGNILRDTGLEPCHLELELTESVLMQHAESTTSVLESLHAMGVRIAVDDFGTGYSSLSYLRRFPIDALKLDRSFVQEITANAEDAVIVSAVISMGNSLRHTVIAEGIETAEQLAFLKTHACDEGQGYYFSRPLLAGNFAKLFKTRVIEAAVTTG
jgi:diguanylate cyclase (GGDEF)-like protein/PAS domain S-box-containing protein